MYNILLNVYDLKRFTSDMRIHKKTCNELCSHHGFLPAFRYNILMRTNTFNHCVLRNGIEHVSDISKFRRDIWQICHVTSMNADELSFQDNPCVDGGVCFVPPTFEDIYFDSNGVLFRNGIAIVDQHGSTIRRPVVECPLPVFRPTHVEPETSALRSNRAIIGHVAHRLTPPVFDPYPAFVESRSVPQVIPGYPRGPVPPGLESLVEHLHHNGQGANSASKGAQMRPASETHGWLIGDPARIAEATRVFNEAHDLIVDHFYNTAAPPVPRPASEPRAPTTDPIDTDSDPADTQSKPLLTNDQGDPVSTTYPFTNFSLPATPNPPGFFDPEDYHWLDDNQIHDLLRRNHEPAQFNRFSFGPQHLTNLYQSAMSAMVSNYTRFPPCDGAECADRVQTFKFITRRYHSLDRVMRRQ
ncbi:hypothetical protein PCASD_01877 [Puccinia coronata f. sp. avenae]|uniref:Uncharacterized protein n=1 Tax=Puccinia coronata f. sp. avenae TaxID=200324 RepID=A0A2N5VJD4_9BASI|nr:hypothetical protein PCASD_01877 [Puccinia coronata f. sp. avenae]